MTNPYKEFWQASNLTEAWLKIVTDTKENPADSALAASYILDGIPQGGTALEIGAGVGRLIRCVAPHFAVVCGVDMSQDMVDLSKTFLKDYPDTSVRLGDGYTMPFGDDTFDFAYSYITFQHMPDLACVRSNIDDMFRVLKPGGLCRVQTIKGVPYSGEFGRGGMYGHYFEREDTFRQEFERAGFVDVTTRVAPVVGTNVISILWLTARKP